VPGLPLDMEQMMGLIQQWPMWFAVSSIAVGPAIAEELWCRAFLGRGFVGRYGVFFGVLLTSIFFGAIHVDPHQGTAAIFMGLILHYTYLVTRSLWVPMLLHFTNNALAVVLPHFSGHQVPDHPAAKLAKEVVDKAAGPVPWDLHPWHLYV